jgi:hypothetical protein
MPHDQFTLLLACGCGARGSVAWEENSAANPRAPQRRMAAVSDGFHAGTGRTPSGDPLIICNGCDQIQPD